MPVNFPGRLNCGEVFDRNASHPGAAGFNAPFDVRNFQRPDQFRMTIHKGADVFFSSGFANRIGHVNREKIRGLQERVHGFETDMVGIHVVRAIPGQFLHGFFSRRAHACRMRADDGVLAVGLVPHGHDIDPLTGRLHASAQLGFGLPGEPVTHAEGEFSQLKRVHHSVQRIIRQIIVTRRESDINIGFESRRLVFLLATILAASGLFFLFSRSKAG